MITKQIQLFKPIFNKEEILSQISECLDNSWTGLGFKTIEFEDKFKEYIKVSHAHFLNSATSGLHLALEIIKNRLNNNHLTQVITSPLTFISASHVIKHAGLDLVFLDIESNLCMNPGYLWGHLSSSNKVLAVIYTGIGGNTGRLYDIVKICDYYNVPLILDASHMMGTYYKNQHVGSEGQDFTVFSFHSVKNLPTADSGMLVCRYSDDDKLARKLSWLGINKDTYNRQVNNGNWEYDVEDIGWKYHGNSIMAAIGIVGLKKLESDNRYRGKIVDTYNTWLNPIYKRIPIDTNCTSPSRHLYQVRVPADHRNKIIEYARGLGIQLGVHYRSHKEYSMYMNCPEWTPNADRISKELISLPIGVHVSYEDVMFIVEKLNAYSF